MRNEADSWSQHQELYKNGCKCALRHVNVTEPGEGKRPDSLSNPNPVDGNVCDAGAVVGHYPEFTPWVPGVIRWIVPDTTIHRGCDFAPDFLAKRFPALPQHLVVNEPNG